LQRITLRSGVEPEDPLGVALGFVEAYPGYDSGEPQGAASFGPDDLRRANRGGARISAAEQAAILARRGRIERALREIDPGASLVGPVPWPALTRLFGAFADIRGVGFSKMTKALHPKRAALIPMLDSFVQAYLAIDDPPDSFADHAVALVRSYKRDLDRNRSALRELRRELASRGHELSEVRILDMLIWSSHGE
jgi:hypothetical protein